MPLLVIKPLSATAHWGDRYAVVGRGQADPLLPNDSLANRARNRRVDIVLLPPVSLQTLAAQQTRFARDDNAVNPVHSAGQSSRRYRFRESGRR